MRFSQQIAALAVSGVLAIAASGCGDGSVKPVALLQMTQPTIVAKKGAAGNTQVRASLSTTANATVAPPVIVPQVGSVAAGAPNNGRLVNGVQLPANGPDWVAFSAPDSRWTTDRMLSYVLAVLRDFRLANPGAPQVVIGDLSLPHGGPMAGHVSHQNGLDADVFYPRLDRSLQVATRVADVDRALAQDLVNRFVAAGAQFAFVGPRVGLGGPRGIVQVQRNHDDHVHVRIANVTSPGGRNRLTD